MSKLEAEFQENLNTREILEEIETPLLIDNSLDNISVIEKPSVDEKVDERETSTNILKQLEPIDRASIRGHTDDIQVKQSNEMSDEEKSYLEMISVQTDIMPKWSQIDINERNSIIKILIRWQGIINTNFERIKSKQKFMKPLVVNENKYDKKGKFNYDSYKTHMKKLQIDLYKILCGKKTPFENCTTQSHNQNLQPNTRLIMRSFKKISLAFECLESANRTTPPFYWSHLAKFIQHISKAVLRCSIYVYENAKLYKCSLGSPPIYVLESDCCDERDIPYVKVETLYEYIYLCLSQLDTSNKSDRKKYGLNLDKETIDEIDENSLKKKDKYYCLTLNCLIRLLQLASLVRDSLTFKQIQYQTDFYSHMLSHETDLIVEYLKEIHKINENK